MTEEKDKQEAFLSAEDSGPEDDTYSGTKEEDQVGSRGESEKLDPGTRVGRYIVLERIGAGGVGQIYSAYDPYLDRKIALKLLKKSSANRSDSNAASYRERLLMEAQAMAQLSHPNIISVFDVGTYHGQVFMAMELVDGSSLDVWLSVKRRSWREKRDVFLRAGRGLAAAHRAGIIHRDFKPSNVLVGQDGEVKVMDFGIAAASHKTITRETDDSQEALDKLRDSDPDGIESLGSGWKSSSVPASGDLVGTPAYMSPEHFRRETIDERSDQFSFCISLFEAMLGKRPFVGRNLKELAGAVTGGKMVPAPRDRHVPTWLRKLILKGMTTDPSGRFADMEALLQALAIDPGKRHKKILLVFGMLVLTAATALSVHHWLGRPGRLCQRAGDKMAEIWNASSKEEVHAAFAKSGIGYSGETLQRVAGMLNEYAMAWTNQRIDACEATNVRGEQSPQMLDKRMLCLDRRLAEMDALVQVFKKKTDAKTIENAVKAVSSLGDLSTCANKEMLIATVALPDNQEDRKRIDQIHAQLNQISSLRITGHAKEGLELARSTLKDALQVNYKPIEGEAQYMLGMLQIATGDYNEAEETFRHALLSASEAADDRTILKIRTAEMYNDGYHLARGELSDKLYTNAMASLRRAEHSPREHSQILDNFGKILFVKGQFADARSYFEKSLAIRNDVLGKEHISVGDTLNNLAVIDYELGDVEQALEHIRQSIAIKKRVLGKTHPSVGLSYNNEGIHLMHLGRLGQAEQVLNTSLDIRENALGKNHPLVAETLTNLGILAAEKGCYERAERVLQRALSIFEQAFGPEHPRVGFVLHVQGIVATHQREMDKATALLEKARVIRERALGKKHYFYAETLMAIGELLIEKDDFQEARKVLDQALEVANNSQGTKEILSAEYARALGEISTEQGAFDQALEKFGTARTAIEKRFGSDHPLTLHVRFLMGKCLLIAGRPKEACTVIEPTLRAMESISLDPGRRGKVRFVLARATWEIGEDRARAVRLAEKAGLEFGQADWKQGKAKQREVARWLREHKLALAPE